MKNKECEKNSKKVTVTFWMKIMQRSLLLPVKFIEKDGTENIEDPKSDNIVQLEVTKTRKALVILFEISAIVICVISFITFQVKKSKYF